jgi:DNA-directed RNA polymerase specialized sigma24 family protein
MRKKSCGDRFCLRTLFVVDQEQSFGIPVFSETQEADAFMSNNLREPEDNASEPEGSVARAIAKYLEGDNSELGELLSALHAELLDKARDKLRNAPNLRAVTDAEGAVSSAVGSYWRALANGKYREMKHGNELKGLLITIVDRKALHQMRKHSRIKAGSGNVINEPATGFEVPGREPSPLEAAVENENVALIMAVVEQWHNLMSEKGLLDVAALNLEGLGYRQIAESLNIREARARRLITMVNSLTRSLANEEIAE